MHYSNTRAARSVAVLAVLALAGCGDIPSEPRAVTGEPLASRAGSAGAALEGRYIVVLRANAGDVRSAAADLTGRHGGEVHYTYTAALRGFAVQRMSSAAAQAIARDPRVALVERDQPMFATGTQSPVPSWGLDRVDQRSLPLSGSFSYTNTGSGVRAYIIDTGIDYAHADFGGRAVYGYDAILLGLSRGDDCNGHGTHVAGTVGGTAYGVAKRTTLVAVRVLGCDGSGSTSGVIAGVDWVTKNHVKPAVANMSLGGGASAALDQAVQNSIAAGVSYAVAAGNGDVLGNAQDACTVSPARAPDAMTIGATDKTDTKASWSNYGDCVDFFAPGVGITSAWIGLMNTDTRTISGTSMAAPHVAGVAALYLQANPSASPQAVRDALYANSTKGIVLTSSTANNHLLYSSY